MPVELLRDERGIYGIGVSDLCDYEAVAWSCGVEPELCTFGSRPSSLILRPDCFADTKPSGAALQKIVGGLRRGPFIRTSEERLRQFIHHTALHRAGLPWPPTDERWWSTDEKQQARNRGIYHGLRQLSLHVVNKLMGQALETAADGEAIRAARRFNFGHRERIYRAGALSGRTLQLIDTFPVLAMTIYSDHWRLRPRLVDFSGADFAARQISAAHLVDRGARLRDIAAVMNIPMTLRHIKPSVAHLATEVLCQHPEISRLHARYGTTAAHLATRGELGLQQGQHRFRCLGRTARPPNSGPLGPRGWGVRQRSCRMGACWRCRWSGGTRTRICRPPVRAVDVA